VAGRDINFPSPVRRRDLDSIGGLWDNVKTHARYFQISNVVDEILAWDGRRYTPRSKAPDAEKLDGLDSTAFMQYSLASGSALPGSPVAGQPFLLRAGSTPYEFIALTYDATYGKWVSAVAHADNMVTANQSTASTTYVAVANGVVMRPFIPGAKALYDAGLRPQFRSACYVENTGVNANNMRVRLYEVNHGDNGVTVIGNAAELQNTNSTGQYTVGTWSATTFEATPAKTHWVIVIEIKTAAGTATFQMMSIHMRWVSA
jgi:hypothetical protein